MSEEKPGAKFLKRAQDLARGAGRTVQSAAQSAGQAVGSATNRISNQSAAWFAGLSHEKVTDAFRGWAEGIGNASTTLYDKAMDAEYARTHIGGGNHRMFDGGHTIGGAWDAVHGASSEDSFLQEVLGYASSLWKDLVTEKGLPFANWTKDSYDAAATWFTERIPGLDRNDFYDLWSFDAGELFGSALGALSLILFLNSEDQEKLAEIMGSAGVVSLLSANPFMGLAWMATCAYAYLVKKKRIDPGRAVRGGATAAVSMALFTILGAVGLPFLIELLIVIVVGHLLRKHVLNDQAVTFISEMAMRAMQRVRQLTSTTTPLLEGGVDDAT